MPTDGPFWLKVGHPHDNPTSGGFQVITFDYPPSTLKHHQMDGKLTKPPAECPDEYKDGVGEWDKEPLDILKSERVPWMVIHRLAKEGWVTLGHLANRWKSTDDLMGTASIELDFTTGANGYTMNDERRAQMGLKDAWKAANRIKESRTELLHVNTNSDPALIMVPGQRESMERSYEAQTGTRPPLEEQGSDHFLGGLYKECAKGSLGAFNNAEIIPKIPEPHTYMKQIAKRRKDEMGRWVENEISERASAPQDYETWKRQMLVFRTSLLMAIFANPTQTILYIPKTKLDNFYKFLYGSELAGRSPPPPLGVMMYAERLAWRRIAIDVHNGTTLDKAIDLIQANSMFWQHEVGDKSKGGFRNGYSEDTWNGSPDRRQRKGKGGESPWSPAKGKAKGKGKDYYQQDYYPRAANWDDGTDSGGGDGGKGKAKSGKSKGGKDTSKNGKGKKKWVSKTNKGQYYCFDYQKGTCTQGKRCASSHMCPVDKGDGTGCNKNHYAAEHQ